MVARVGYVYPIAYSVPASAAQSFGLTCTNNTPTGPQCILPADVRTAARQTTTVWQTLQSTVGGMDAAGQGLGGFTFDVQHAYDPIGGVLFAGDGTRRATGSLPEQVTRFAGLGVGSNLNDTTQLLSGVSALSPHSRVARPGGIAFGADGSVYFADANTQRIRRVLNGIITTVAGSGNFFGGFSGDGGPGTAARLNQPIGLGIGPDGSLYFVDRGNLRIRRVAPNGIITTIAGTGGGCSPGNSPCGDGGPALLAGFVNPNQLAVGPDGSVYVADEGANRIRQILPNGTIRTAVGVVGDICQNRGGGYFADCGENRPGTSVPLRFPRSVAIGPDGSLYFSSQAFQYGERVRRMTPDGLVHTIAGSDAPVSFLGDGGPALQATLRDIWSIGVGPDGTLYVAEEGNEQPPHVRVRRVRPDGLITTAVGDGNRFTTPQSAGNNGPSLRARIGRVQGLGVGLDGALYLSDDNQVRRVSAPLPGLLAGTTVIASEDGSELYVFSPAGRILLTLDAVTRDTLYTFGYNAARQLVSIRDIDGRVTQIERDSVGRPVATITPTGQRTDVTLDANGSIAGLRGPDGLPVGLRLDGAGMLTAVVSKDGDTLSVKQYDAAGRLVLATNAMGGQSTYSRSGAEILIADPTGRSVTIEQEDLPDGSNRLTTTVLGGMTQRTTIDPAGRTVVTAPNGTVTTYTQTPDPRFGMQAPRVEEVVQTPSGLAKTRQVRRGVTLGDPDDPLSLLVQVDSVIVNGRVRTARVDNVASTVTTTSAAGRIVVYQRDARGRVTRTSVPGVPDRTFAYDALGRRTMTRIGGRTRTLGYDARDRLTSVIDEAGLTHTFSHDDNGRVTERQAPDGGVVAMAYDTNGRVTGVTPPGRPTHVFAFNSAGRATRYTAPDAGTGAPVVSYEYDAAGRLSVLRRADSSVVSIAYDSLTGSRTVTLSGGDTLRLVREGSTGRLTQGMFSGGAGYANAYDGGLLIGTTWTGAVQASISYAYDSDFRLRSQDVNGGGAVMRSYDADGLLAAVGGLTFTRHSGNGTVSSATIGGVRTDFAYAPGPEVSGIHATLGQDTLFAVVLQRDSLGRIVTRTELIAGTTSVASFAYDSAGRLVQVVRDGSVAEGYEYDANGNRTRATTAGGTAVAVTDAQDRLLTHGAVSYTYAPSGERRRRIAGMDTTVYAYDALGNLRNVTVPGTTIIDYVVDVDGRRVGKRVNGSLVRAWVPGRQLDVAAELDGAGQIVSRFVYGERANVPEYMTRNGATYRIVTDERGSVRLVVDVATGAIAQRMDYDAFGRVALNTQPDFQPFGFAGGLYDHQTGLVRFGARDYDAEAGRWTTKDPIGFEGGDANLYSYVSGDPVNAVDPTGLTQLLEFEATAPGRAAVAGANATATRTVLVVLRNAGRGPLPPGLPPVLNPLAVTALVAIACVNLAIEIFSDDDEGERLRECEERYYREVGVCDALPTPRERLICRQTAMTRWNQCKDGIPEDDQAPLFPFYNPR